MNLDQLTSLLAQFPTETIIVDDFQMVVKPIPHRGSTLSYTELLWHKSLFLGKCSDSGCHCRIASVP